MILLVLKELAHLSGGPIICADKDCFIPREDYTCISASPHAILTIKLLAIPLKRSKNLMDDKKLRRADAREFIRGQGIPLAERTLDVWASRGKGPKFTYDRTEGGPISSFYAEEDLMEFVEQEKARGVGKR
jgi:hypothetical protein